MTGACVMLVHMYVYKIWLVKMQAFSFIDMDMLYWSIGALNLMRKESVTNISEEKR